MARYRVPFLCAENVDTSDGRVFASFTTREGPLTLMGLRVTPGGMDMPHSGAEVIGQMDTPQRDGNGVWSTIIDTNEELEAGRDFTAMIDRGDVLGISVDAAALPEDVDFECVELDDDGFCVAGHVVFQSAEIGGATVCGFPAFADAIIDNTRLDDAEMTPGDQSGETTDEDAALVASSVVEIPPAAWFTDPQLGEVTPLTVTDDGRVFGHLAPWDTEDAPSCHVGRPDLCLSPPHSETGYAYFHTGETMCSTPDGSTVRLPTGRITMGTGHAPTTGPGSSPSAAAAHYDNTGAVVATVCVGEDDHGIWVAGALRFGVTQAQVRDLMACGGLSGDWRRIGSHPRELIAALAVNAGGFPIPRVRAGMTASGEMTALVAAGATRMARLAGLDPDDCGCDGQASRRRVPATRGSADAAWKANVERQLATIMANVRALAPLAAQQIETRVPRPS